MSAQLIVKQIADDVIEIPVASPSEAQSLARALRTALTAEDIVAGLASVCIRVQPEHAASVMASISGFSFRERHTLDDQEPIEIGIRYGGENGPDFDAVCHALELTGTQFIALHTGRRHKIEMIGFTPGFAYISGLPETASIPRLSNPRARVAAGSVGISSAYTGMYALPGPGGWPLIGQTDAPLFVSSASSPFLLEPGRFVQFKAA
ncbi:MAG: carboxyltransferase domain-containing protein [Pseudomonadota bacterium]